MASPANITKQNSSPTSRLFCAVGCCLSALAPGLGWAQPAPPPNDNFAQASLLRGTSVAGTNTSITAATMELGEADHLDGQTCKSLWWRWQATVNGQKRVQAPSPAPPNLASNITIAVYTGSDVESLTLVAKGPLGYWTFDGIGGTVYQIAAVVPASVTGDATFQIIEYINGLGSAPTYAVPGNLLTNPSFESSSGMYTGWSRSGSFVGGTGADEADGKAYAGMSLSWILVAADIIDIASLAQKLTNHLDPVSLYLWNNLGPQQRATLIDTNPMVSPEFKKTAFYYCINPLIRTQLIYDVTRFAGVALSADTTNLLAQNPQGEEMVHLNRLLLEDVYPQEIARRLPTRLWQDFATVPGRQYAVAFATRGTNSTLRVCWDDQVVGVATLPANEGGYWHWAKFIATATASTSRLALEFPNSGTVHLDALSVVWMSEPPALVTLPKSLSAVGGATASFLVGATGTAPLAYQWYFNGAPFAGKTSKLLVLDNVSETQNGEYFVTVTNAFGAVTSPPVTLSVEAPSSPVILVQPWGDKVIPGGYFALSVTAMGLPPLGYQWFFNGTELAGATSRQLVFSSFDLTNAGSYSVRVTNASGEVWSLPATLKAGDGSLPGGGTLLLANRYLDGPKTNEAPVLDIDGSTKISGPDYVAQLYAGPGLALLRAVGTPTPFRGTFDAGFFEPKTVTLPNVAPGSNAVAQVRVWQLSKGASYEEARVLGGIFGRSEILPVTAGSAGATGNTLHGLSSFALQAGLPQFTVGRIEWGGQPPGGPPTWSLVGAAGCRYLIERSLSDYIWRPMLVVTNATGTVNFSDPAATQGEPVFYRARILE